MSARAALLALAFLAAGACSSRADIDAPDRSVASIFDVPQQSAGDAGSAVAFDDVRAIPRASYEISARLLSTERYRLDPLAHVAPVDFALAWGPAAAEEVQAELRVDQGNRWFYWRTRGDRYPLPRRQLVASMANVHIVPADDAVRSTLLDFEAGECVWMRGDLVDIDSDDDPSLERRTSLSRTDAGAGSCEILLVREAASVACE